MHMNRITSVGILVIFLLSLIGEHSSVLAYDSSTYKKVNSSLSCQCGCGLLVSVCTMEGCMCEGVRQQVGELLDQGYNEKEVKQAMMSSYGEQILAAPPKSGFNLSAYILPFLFLILGASVLYSIISKWTPAFKGRIKGNNEGNMESEKNISQSKMDQIENELDKLDY